MFNGSFLSSSSRASFRSSRAFPREKRCWWQRHWREMVVVVAVDTSFIFHPTTHRARVSVVLSHLLQPPSWRHLGHSHYLVLFVPLSPSFLRCLDRKRKPGFALPSCRCFSLFLLFFISFLSASIPLYPPHFSLPSILFLLSFLLLRLFVRVLRIFWQLFRRILCLRVFSFCPKV